MPQKALAITSQHHPVAVCSYVGITSLAVMYLAGIASAASMVTEVGERMTWIWQILLLIGGLLAVISVSLSTERHILRALSLESLGTLVIGIEFGIYVAVLMMLDSMPWASIIMFGVIALGCLCRSYTAHRDRQRVIRAALAMKPASPVPLGEAE